MCDEKSSIVRQFDVIKFFPQIFFLNRRSIEQTTIQFKVLYASPFSITFILNVLWNKKFTWNTTFGYTCVIHQLKLVWLRHEWLLCPFIRMYRGDQYVPNGFIHVNIEKEKCKQVLFISFVLHFLWWCFRKYGWIDLKECHIETEKLHS